MKHGKALVDVKSRKGKTPLYFNLPHGQVEVTGTQFELTASKVLSSVAVTEGTVNYLAGGKQVSVSTGQVGVSSKSFLKATYNLHETLLHYSFDSPDSAPDNLDEPQLMYGVSGNCLKMNNKSQLLLKTLSPSPVKPVFLGKCQ